MHNAAKYLGECLRSIQSQTEKNFELIAVENGSTDASLEILREFAARDARLRLVSLPDAGILPALSNVERMACGDLICRMDADDRMPPRRLEIQSRLVLDSKQAMVASGRVQYFSDGVLGDGFRRYGEWLNGLHTTAEHLEELFVECVLPSPGWMTRREDFLKLGGFSGAVYPEDYDLTFKMFAAGFQVAKTTETILEWRDHPERSSRNLEVYLDQKFWPLKARYFSVIHGRRVAGRELVIWGMGRTAKSLLESFRQAGNEIRKMVTDNPRKIGMTYEGLPVEPTLALDPKKYFVLIAVSSRGARVEINEKLKNLGFEKIRDYTWMI